MDELRLMMNDMEMEWKMKIFQNLIHVTSVTVLF